MAHYRLWATIRKLTTPNVVFVITIVAAPETMRGRIEFTQEWASTRVEAEGICSNAIVSWRYEMESRGHDCVVDFVEDLDKPA